MVVYLSHCWSSGREVTIYGRTLCCRTGECQSPLRMTVPSQKDSQPTSSPTASAASKRMGVHARRRPSPGRWSRQKLCWHVLLPAGGELPPKGVWARALATPNWPPSGKASPFRGIYRATPSECRGAVRERALALLQADSTSRARGSILFFRARASTGGCRRVVVDHPRKSRSRKLPRIGQRFDSGQSMHLSPLQAGRVDTVCSVRGQTAKIRWRRGVGGHRLCVGRLAGPSCALGRAIEARRAQPPNHRRSAVGASRPPPARGGQEGTGSGPFDCPCCGRPLSKSSWRNGVEDAAATGVVVTALVGSVGLVYATGDRARGIQSVTLSSSAWAEWLDTTGALRRPTRWAAVELTAVILGRGSGADPTWPPRRFALYSWLVAQLLRWQRRLMTFGRRGPSLGAGSPAGRQISCRLQPGGATPHVPRHTPPGDGEPDAGAGTSLDRRGPGQERDRPSFYCCDRALHGGKPRAGAGDGCRRLVWVSWVRQQGKKHNRGAGDAPRPTVGRRTGAPRGVWWWPHRGRSSGHPPPAGSGCFPRGRGSKLRAGRTQWGRLPVPPAPSAPVRAPTGRDLPVSTRARWGGAATGTALQHARTRPVPLLSLSHANRLAKRARARRRQRRCWDHAHNVLAAGPCFNSRRVAAPTSRVTGALATPRRGAFKSEGHHPRNQHLPSPSSRIPVGPPLPLRHVWRCQQPDASRTRRPHGVQPRRPHGPIFTYHRCAPGCAPGPQWFAAGRPGGCGSRCCRSGRRWPNPQCSRRPRLLWSPVAADVHPHPLLRRLPGALAAPPQRAQPLRRRHWRQTVPVLRGGAQQGRRQGGGEFGQELPDPTVSGTFGYHGDGGVRVFFLPFELDEMGLFVGCTRMGW